VKPFSRRLSWAGVRAGATVALADYLEQAPVFVRTLDGEITYWPEGAQKMYGYTAQDALGHRSHELLRTVFPARLTEIDAALKTYGEWQGLLRHRTESVWRLRKDAAGRAIVVEANTDVTQRELLTRELDHRLKDTLAVVQSIARLTFAEADRSHVERFEERLIALSRPPLCRGVRGIGRVGRSGRRRCDGVGAGRAAD
jgi:PAS domain S-box-containing protein